MSSSGSSGLEAITIGYTLVGCIGACSGLGYWLDNHFGTGFCLPVLFVVGAIAGFREMFVTLGRISKEDERKRREAKAKVQTAPASFGRTAAEEPEVETAKPRERIFKVPPPPLGGETTSSKPQTDATSDTKFDAGSEDVDKLIEQLLQDDSDDGPEPKR